LEICELIQLGRSLLSGKLVEGGRHATI
jgi:hypothetical protein